MTMRSVSSVLIPLTVAILAGSAQPTVVRAQAAHTTERFTEPFDTIVSASDGCTGEDVHVFGPVDGIIQTTTDGRGGFHFEAHFTPHLSAIGLSSGLEYHAQGPARVVTFDGPLPSVVSLTDVIRLISPGSGDNLVLTELMHVTVDANGSTTVSFDRVKGGCLG
jgi:hypothetical protein